MNRTALLTLLATLALALLLPTEAQAMYHPRLGRFLQRDPIGYGRHELAASLYEYANSDPHDYVDPSGAVPEIPWHPNAPCGKFIIRSAIVEIPAVQQRAAGGNTLKGFEVQFDKKGCDEKCPCDSIRVVQAVACGGLMTGTSPHFDVSGQREKENEKTPGGIPPPAYTDSGARGKHGPLSYRDAPLNPRKLSGSSTYYITACAVCTKKDEGGQRVEMLLGCVIFTFDDVSREFDAPDGKPHLDNRKKPDGMEFEPVKPDYPWPDAMRKWTKSAAPEKAQ